MARWPRSLLTRLWQGVQEWKCLHSPGQNQKDILISVPPDWDRKECIHQINVHILTCSSKAATRTPAVIIRAVQLNCRSSHSPGSTQFCRKVNQWIKCRYNRDHHPCILKILQSSTHLHHPSQTVILVLIHYPGGEQAAVQRLPLGLPHYDSSYLTGQGSDVGATPILRYVHPKHTLTDRRNDYLVDLWDNSTSEKFHKKVIR